MLWRGVYDVERCVRSCGDEEKAEDGWHAPVEKGTELTPGVGWGKGG